MYQVCSKYTQLCSQGHLNVWPIMTLTFWPWKSIGLVLSSWAALTLSLIEILSKLWSLSCSQCYIHICPFWPWLLTSNLSKRRFALYLAHKVKHINGTIAALLHPLCNTLLGDNKQKANEIVRKGNKLMKDTSNYWLFTHLAVIFRQNITKVKTMKCRLTHLHKALNFKKIK